MRNFLRGCAALAALAQSVVCANAGPAPKQLYNKSVVIHWVESTLQRAPDGSSRNPQINTTRTVYVSSAGRVFVKGTRSIKNRLYQGNKNTARGPEGGGGSGGLAFEGNQLVGTAVFDGGARRLSVSFDPSFSSCTANVVYGKSGSGNQKWKTLDGSQTFELISVSVGAVGCSIREGNAVAE